MSKTALLKIKSFQLLVLIGLVAGIGFAFAQDTDSDGMSDLYEQFFNLNPTNALDAVENYDGDGLTNLTESLLWTDPYSADTDSDGFDDSEDNNALSRALIMWADRDFTDGDTYAYTGPDWWLGAGKNGGSWQKGNYWQLAEHREGSLYIDIDRTILTNNVMMDLLHRDAPGSEVYLDLVDSNDSPVATNLFGNISSGGDGKVFRRYTVPLAAYPAASRLVIRALTGETAYKVWSTSLYVDSDTDGLDADQELQVGTLDTDEDCDDDALTDYAEIMVTHTDPWVPDTDSDDLMDGDELVHGTDPLLSDTDADTLTDGEEVHIVLTDPLLSDTDGDGVGDGEERAAGLNPLSADTDGDGILDYVVFGGSFYLPVYETITWSNAMADAQLRGGQLATVASEGEHNRLVAAVGKDVFKSNSLWIGACRNTEHSDWEWIDGSIFDYARWWNDAPLYTGEVYRCVFYSKSKGNGRFWVNGSIEGEKGYVLEYANCTNSVAADTDGDGLTDWVEMQEGCNPFVVDTDGDGLGDADEIGLGTNPARTDTDKDGLSDHVEATGVTNPLSADSDSDGLLDNEELVSGADPLNPDSDADGLLDGKEIAAGSNPLLADTDADGMGDHYEVFFNLNPADGSDAQKNGDKDALNNLSESQLWTNPNVADTDKDGFFDGADSNALSRAVVMWANKKFTDGVEYAYTGPEWFLGAGKRNGSWKNGDYWRLSEGAQGSLFIDLDRTVLTNNVMMDLLHQDAVGSLVQLDLLDVGGNTVVSNLLGDLTGDEDGKVFRRHMLPLEDYPTASRIVIRAQTSAAVYKVWSTILYIDNDADGLDSDQELQVGTLDSDEDCDDDALTDYAEVMVTHTNPWIPDTDADQVADGYEVEVGTNPLLPDTDSDTLTDGEEIYIILTDPLLADTDGDGVGDGEERAAGLNPLSSDTDGDGILDYVTFGGSFYLSVSNAGITWTEALEDAQMRGGQLATVTSAGEHLRVVAALGKETFTENSHWIGLFKAAETSDWQWVDDEVLDFARWWKGAPINNEANNRYAFYSKGKGLGRSWVNGKSSDGKGAYILEYANCTNSVTADSDADGLTDYTEMQIGCNPYVVDTDSDGINDFEEVETGLDPVNTDSDADGLADGEELLEGTDPLIQDTDEDGLMDGAEIAIGTLPLKVDTDTDGFADGADSNALSRAVVRWANDRFTTGNEYFHPGPEWWVGAGKQNGSWKKGFWQLGSKKEGSLYIDLNRSALTNNVMMDLLHRDAPKSLVYVDLLGTNGNAVATNLFGDITTDADGKVFRRYSLPLASYPDASRIVIRVKTAKQEYKVWSTILYVDDDADGLDADQELQVGTLDSDDDCDDDTLSDYAEVMVTHTDPLSPDTDVDDLSDSDELIYGTDPLLPDTDADMLTDGEEVHVLLTNPLLLDTDGDGVGDGEERAAGLNPLLADTDGDGISDYVAFGGSFYVPIYDTTTWSNAVSDAQLRGGHLASILTEGEHVRLVAAVGKDVFKNNSLWIGGFKAAETGNWEWVTGEVFEYTRWWDETPINTGEVHRCVFYSKSKGTGRFWVNGSIEGEKAGYFLEYVNCTNSVTADTDGDGMTDFAEMQLGCNPYAADIDLDGLTDPEEVALGTDPIRSDTDKDGLLDGHEVTLGTDPFEKDTDSDGLSDYVETEGSAYALVKKTLFWRKAVHDAEMRGGHLAVITSDAEHHEMANAVGNKKLGNFDLWIGLTDQDEEGVWTWITGEAFEYSRWEKGEPGKDHENQDWVGYRNNDEWSNMKRNKYCDGFILEYEGVLDPINPDCDGDGLTDGEEVALGSNPQVADTDGDGLTDAEEAALGTDLSEVDTDGDGLSDSDEVNVYGTDPLVIDSDHDGLNDGAEVNLGTDPNVADTDGDGIEDGQEVHLALTDPLVADLGEEEVLSVFNGADFVASTCSWGTDGTVAYAYGRNGELEYSLEISTNGSYALEVEVTEHNQAYAQNQYFSVSLLVDGLFVGRARAYVEAGGTDTLKFWMPPLDVGTHTVGIKWNNLTAGPSLQVNALRVLTYGGSDLDGNGQLDWMDTRLGNLTGEVAAPEGSPVSPVCLEGESYYVDLVKVTSDFVPVGSLMQDIRVKDGIGDGWYADIMLAPDYPSLITIDQNNGAGSEEIEVVWQETNLFDTPTNTVTIRLNDALLLGALPESAKQGSMVITVDGPSGASDYASHTEVPVPVIFDEPGLYTVSSLYSKSRAVHVDSNSPTNAYGFQNGTAANGVFNQGNTVQGETFYVNVVDAGFSGNPAVLVGYKRDWDCSNMPTNMVVEYDSNLTLSRNPDLTVYRLGITGSEEQTVLARLTENGPVVDRATVTPVHAITGGYWKLVTEYPDGSALAVATIVMDHVPEDLVIELTVKTSGTTFDDGSLTRTLTAADFDEQGVATYYMVMSETRYRVCHRIDFIQDGAELGSF